VHLISQEGRSTVRIRRVGYLAVAAVVLAVVCYLATAPLLRWRARVLLADVYTRTRPFAFRLPDHGYGPVKNGRHNPGAQKLIEAVRLLRLLEGWRGDDPRLRQLLGRASFLGGSLDDAVKDYQLSLELDADSAETRLELAGALLTRAREQRRPADLALALEQMGQAEGFEPRTAAGAFNLALLYEALPAPHLSAAEWRRSLRLESQPAWRSEVESRLARLDALLTKRARRMAALAGSPEAYLTSASAQEYPVETVFEPAIMHWLPLRDKNPAAARALAALADRSVGLHHDPWLRDLLRLPGSDDEDKAYAALGQAMRANREGLHQQVDAPAAAARRLFEKLGNRAGALAARLQSVYAANRLNSNSAECSEGQKLANELERTGYAWLAAQSWLELSVCAFGSADGDRILAAQEAALHRIERTGYQGLAMRARGFLIQPNLVRANPIRLWRVSQEELEHFWNGEFSPSRAQQYYLGTALAARDSRLYFAATALAREGVKVMDEIPNPHWRALCLSVLGSAELAAGLNARAARTFGEAEDLFTRADPAQSEQRYRVEASLFRADARAQAAKPAQAVQILAPLFQHPSSAIYGYSQVESKLGLAYLRLGNLSAARTCFRDVAARTREELEKVSGREQRDALLESAERAYRGEIQLKLAVEKDPAGAFALWKQFRALRHPAAAGRVAAALPPDVAALVIVSLPAGTAIFAADHAGVEARWLEGSARAFEATARRFTQLCGTEDSPAAEIDRIGRGLYDKLILSFEHRLSGKRILAISAEGAAGGMPWSVLRDRRGTLLIEKQSIVLGSEFALGPAPPSLTSRRPPLVIAAPALAAELAGEFPPLPDEEEQGRRIAAAFPGTRFLTGRQATVKALKEFLPQSTFFHFGGHGMTNGGYGAILLASEPGQSYGGVLGSPEIAGLDLHGVRVISLASCSSGVGEWTGFVDPDSLVRSLLDAGARNVIAAPWKVDSAATGDLFGDLYERLSTSHSVAESLRQACLRVHGRKRTEHPYFWAGFQTYGVPD
jgi:CHAT domain-containing protein